MPRSVPICYKDHSRSPPSQPQQGLQPQGRGDAAGEHKFYEGHQGPQNRQQYNQDWNSGHESAGHDRGRGGAGHGQGTYCDGQAGGGHGQEGRGHSQGHGYEQGGEGHGQVGRGHGKEIAFMDEKIPGRGRGGGGHGQVLQDGDNGPHPHRDPYKSQHSDHPDCLLYVHNDLGDTNSNEKDAQPDYHDDHERHPKEKAMGYPPDVEKHP